MNKRKYSDLLKINLNLKHKLRIRIRNLLARIKRFLFKIRRIKVEADIVKLETYFPQENPSGARNAEINYLLEKIKTFITYRPFPMTREVKNFDPNELYCGEIGTSELKFIEDKKGYLRYYKKSAIFNNSERIKYLFPNINLKANLAFTTFLGQTYLLSPYLKKNKIPFVFMLYPGGSFGLNNDISNNMLKDIFSNKYFKKVIVSNDIIFNYLLENNFCPVEKIEFLFGGPVQFNQKHINISKKKFFPKDKNYFDICFVAYNYGDRGLAKGYDLFIEAAKKIAKSANQNFKKIRFHVVGNFDNSVIDISEIESRLIFHGVRDTKWLIDFYYEMEVVICANRPNSYFKGSFDGYPMAPEQSLCGVAMFQSDELNINQDYKYYKKNEIVHIKLDINDIVRKIEYYFKNLDKLYNLANNGRKKTEVLFNFESRMTKLKNILLTTAKRN